MAEQYEEKGLHPKSWLWVPEMKTTGKCEGSRWGGGDGALPNLGVANRALV